MLRGHRVACQVDNLNLANIVVKGSRNGRLSEVAKLFFHLRLEESIQLQIVWVRRQFNQAADDLSRLSDKDDCMLNQAIFRGLDSLLFALGSEGVDAFAHSWQHQLPFRPHRACPL